MSESVKIEAIPLYDQQARTRVTGYKIAAVLYEADSDTTKDAILAFLDRFEVAVNLGAKGKQYSRPGGRALFVN